MVNKIKISCFSLIAFCLFFSGIIRHDVSKEAYQKWAGQKQFACVGELFYSDSTRNGSCVLISDKYVLTAAHCVTESLNNKDTIIQYNGNTIYTYIEGKMTPMASDTLYVSINHQIRMIEHIIIHPNYLKDKECDIAILKLKEGIKGIAFPALNQKTNELHSKVTGVGYGVFCVTDEPNNMSYGEKIAGNNMVDSISGYLYNGQNTLLLYDFDHPSMPQLNRMGDAVPLALEYKSNGGDSGGGLFRHNKNQWELVGICAGGGLDVDYFSKSNTYYGQISSYTRISAFYNWIQLHTH